VRFFRPTIWIPTPGYCLPAVPWPIHLRDTKHSSAGKPPSRLRDPQRLRYPPEGRATPSIALMARVLKESGQQSSSLQQSYIRPGP
jgi:hypothetical protein